MPRYDIDASVLTPGVDLVPIRPIPNVVTLQEDITTEKCRQVRTRIPCPERHCSGSQQVRWVEGHRPPVWGLPKGTKRAGD